MAFLFYNYSAPVNIRQSAASAAGSTVWAMRNDSASSKTIYIERVELNMAFDAGTPIARSLQRYDLIRFSGATPTGGTSQTVVAMDSSAPATQVTDVRSLDTGLSTSGISFGTSLLTIGVPASDGATVNYSSSVIPIVLAPGEGFCVRLNNQAVIGQSVTGFISWSER